MQREEMRQHTTKEKRQHLRVCFKDRGVILEKLTRLFWFPFLGYHCCSGLMTSGGQGVSFSWTQITLSHCNDSQGSFRTVYGLSGMPASGHIRLPWLRGFPHYRVVPETETLIRMSAVSICD